ncbi:hypothetical protein SADUNF_Sadunf17G0068600 [Salix dunnii]|uniref:Uncharacterized protein n=1 Tax=Salix dunnii TaxID=1413687 RepID=A0A835J6W1_9ROSI|nr:hypothetical protein SADUNF_Sadunf17G0068600 [Salix dunnii]
MAQQPPSHKPPNQSTKQHNQHHHRKIKNSIEDHRIVDKEHDRVFPWVQDSVPYNKVNNRIRHRMSTLSGALRSLNTAPLLYSSPCWTILFLGCCGGQLSSWAAVVSLGLGRSWFALFGLGFGYLSLRAWAEHVGLFGLRAWWCDPPDGLGFLLFGCFLLVFVW